MLAPRNPMATNPYPTVGQAANPNSYNQEDRYRQALLAVLGSAGPTSPQANMQYGMFMGPRFWNPYQTARFAGMGQAPTAPVAGQTPANVLLMRKLLGL